GDGHLCGRRPRSANARATRGQQARAVMGEHHYKSNLRDIEFNLFELLRIQDTTLGKGEFTSMDEATVRDTLKGVAQIAENELARSFVDADRKGLKFDGEGNVT